MATDEKKGVLTRSEAEELLAGLRGRTLPERIKVLIVEDDPTTKLLYDKGLFSEIFDKKMVVSGKEALIAYEEWHPDIIVLDIFLPEMTGYQVLKTIRNTIADKQTAIVMATSLSGNEDVLSCMKLGIEGYIIKPFQVLEIGGKILTYYAKKEPARGRSAEALYREITKKLRMNLLLDRDRARTAATAEKPPDEAADAATGGADQKGGQGKPEEITAET